MGRAGSQRARPTRGARSSIVLEARAEQKDGLCAEPAVQVALDGDVHRRLHDARRRWNLAPQS